jgi:DNA topoisomerase-1
MNMNYRVAEADKDYGIHPVSDGTFYCSTRPQVGNSEVKYYTLEYKRRARRMKYDTVGELGKTIRKVRRRLFKHARSADRDTRIRALMCLIIDTRCARIGNTESARGEKKTYGITTLLTRKHVHVKDGYIILRYAGKDERPQKHKYRIYTDPIEKQQHKVEAVIGDGLAELMAENNHYLFTRANGKPFTPQSVNEYFTADKPDLDKGLPEGGAAAPCTVHNLRNYHATRIFTQFRRAFARKQPSPTYDEVLAAYQGCSRTRNRRAKRGVLDIIADKLGNTPAICRKAYIDPREQLMFFKQFGCRPPDCLIRDVFVHEPNDTYGVEDKDGQQERLTPCNKPVCHLKTCVLGASAADIDRRRAEVASHRHKKL